MVRSRVLLPAPDGPMIEVILPSGTPASTPLRISTTPAAYRRLEIFTLSLMLEHFPSQVGVEAIIEGVGVVGEGFVVGKGELHPTDYRV